MTTTTDAFLGGRVTLRQPARGFRSGSDAVLLAACCPARQGDTVLDLGCGTGAAMLCVAARVAGVRATGLEIDANAVALARENAAPWGAEVVEGDALAPPSGVRGRAFDHVIANPPYHVACAGTGSPDAAREAALREAVPGLLAAWCDVACRRAGPKGSVATIARADRLADLLGALAPRLGAVTVLPISGEAGRPANRVVVRGRKGSRAPLRLLPPLVTHAGERTTPEAEAVLRGNAALMGIR